MSAISMHAQAPQIRTVRRNQNLTRTAPSLKMGPVSATFVVVAMVSLLALLYLNQVTKTSVFSYKVNDLSAQRDKLVAAKKDLSVEAARLQSLQTLQKSTAVTNMVPTGQVSYAR